MSDTLRVPTVALDAEIGRQAAIVAYADDFRFMMFVAMAALPLLLLLRNPRAQRGGARASLELCALATSWIRSPTLSVSS